MEALPLSLVEYSPLAPTLTEWLLESVKFEIPQYHMLLTFGRCSSKKDQLFRINVKA